MERLLRGRRRPESVEGDGAGEGDERGGGRWRGC